MTTYRLDITNVDNAPGLGDTPIDWGDVWNDDSDSTYANFGDSSEDATGAHGFLPPYTGGKITGMKIHFRASATGDTNQPMMIELDDVGPGYSRYIQFHGGASTGQSSQEVFWGEGADWDIPNDGVIRNYAMAISDHMAVVNGWDDKEDFFFWVLDSLRAGGMSVYFWADAYNTEPLTYPTGEIRIYEAWLTVTTSGSDVPERIYPESIEPSRDSTKRVLITNFENDEVEWGSGGGSSNLDGLDDVEITSPSTNQALIWDGSKWVNETLAGGGGPIALDDLTDVAISSPSTSQILTFNGTNWVNSAAGGGSLSSLTDTSLTSLSNGEFLRYNGSAWVNATYTPPVQNIDWLSDVDTTTQPPSGGQVLWFDSVKWVPHTMFLSNINGNVHSGVDFPAADGYLLTWEASSSLWKAKPPSFAPIASPTFTGDPKAPTPATGDNDTSIATTAFVKAQAYATLASPALTGTPTAPTATSGTNTTQIATTAFVQTAVGLYAPLASPALTGTPTAPTATAGTNTTQIATTAFVTNATSSLAPLASPTFTGDPKAPTPSTTDSDTSIATTAYTRSAIEQFQNTRLIESTDDAATVAAANNFPIGTIIFKKA